MALDKIQAQFGLGLNPFVKPKDAEDGANTSKTRGVGYQHSKHVGRQLALGEENKLEKRPDGISFLKEGALGDEEAIYVNNGRAGGKLNMIS